MVDTHKLLLYHHKLMMTSSDLSHHVQCTLYDAHHPILSHCNKKFMSAEVVDRNHDDYVRSVTCSMTTFGYMGCSSSLTSCIMKAWLSIVKVGKQPTQLLHQLFTFSSHPCLFMEIQVLFFFSGLKSPSISSAFYLWCTLMVC